MNTPAFPVVLQPQLTLLLSQPRPPRVVVVREQGSHAPAWSDELHRTFRVRLSTSIDADVIVPGLATSVAFVCCEGIDLAVTPCRQAIVERARLVQLNSQQSFIIIVVESEADRERARDFQWAHGSTLPQLVFIPIERFADTIERVASRFGDPAWVRARRLEAEHFRDQVCTESTIMNVLQSIPGVECTGPDL